MKKESALKILPILLIVGLGVQTFISCTDFKEIEFYSEDEKARHFGLSSGETSSSSDGSSSSESSSSSTEETSGSSSSSDGSSSSESSSSSTEEASDSSSSSDGSDSSSSSLDASSSSVVFFCNGDEYDPNTEFCLDNDVKPLCNGFTYESYQFCYNDSKIGDYCGSRPEIFDPDKYDCREGSKIYLTEPVAYGVMQEYEAVLIGDQTWFARDLSYYDLKVGSHHEAHLSLYSEYTHYLYDWATAVDLLECKNFMTPCPYQAQTRYQGICPDGWHIPSNNEWEDLITAVGGAVLAGTQLKYNSHWPAYVYGALVRGDDPYGFAALPEGGGVAEIFDSPEWGCWWSTNHVGESSGDFWYMGGNYAGVYKSSGYNETVCSVRCVKDGE